jgi:protein HOOK3
MGHWFMCTPAHLLFPYYLISIAIPGGSGRTSVKGALLLLLLFFCCLAAVRCRVVVRDTGASCSHQHPLGHRREARRGSLPTVGEMADDKRERAFRRWVNSVEGLSSTCDSFEDLHDGVLLSEILGQAAPSDIATEDIDDAPASDEAKAKNIRTIVSGLVSFYSDTFGSTETFEEVDAKAIATRGAGMHKSLHLLLELVIGCVINCSDKATYIEAIQGMDPESQTQIMHVIQDIMMKYADGSRNESLDDSFGTPLTSKKAHTGSGSSSGSSTATSTAGGGEGSSSGGTGSDEEVRRLRKLVDTLRAELDAKAQDAHALAAEVSTLRQEMLDAAKREKAKELEKMKVLKTAMSQREVEISGGLRDLESQCTQLTQANALLQRQLNQKDVSWKEKMQAQADELAILRAGAGRLDQLESKLKRRDAEMAGVAQLREHLQAVETQNLELADKNSTLHAEAAKIPALNKQLQAYRDKLTVRLRVCGCFSRSLPLEHTAWWVAECWC